MLRPAAKIDQQPVKHRRRRRLAHAKCLAGAQDRALGRVGGGGDMGAKARQSCDLGCEIARGERLPGGIGPLPAAGRPQRLPPVEVPAGPETDGALDHGGPVDAARLGGKISDARQGTGNRPGCCGRLLQSGDVMRPERRG